MSIVTLCKSCQTINRTIIDRCKYCGSQRVEVKSIDSELIYRFRGREVLTRIKENANKQARS